MRGTPRTKWTHRYAVFRGQSARNKITYLPYEGSSEIICDITRINSIDGLKRESKDIRNNIRGKNYIIPVMIGALDMAVDAVQVGNN